MYSLRILLFGDFNQCIPIEDNFYDYYNNETFRRLVDFNEMKLEYIEETARFDRKTYDLVNKLLQEGTYSYENPLNGDVDDET